MDKKKKVSTRVLVECALLIAIGTILAQIKLFRMPMGGSVTAVSMLPFILISFRHGTRMGVLSGIVNFLLQMALGGVYMPPAGSVTALIGSIVFDYAIAYICLGFASFFAKPSAGGSFGAKGVMLGTLAVCIIRFLCAFISGFLIWGSITEDGIGAVIYSLTYNASYMIPETAITMLVLFLLYKKVPALFHAEN